MASLVPILLYKPPLLPLYLRSPKLVSLHLHQQVLRHTHNQPPQPILPQVPFILSQVHSQVPYYCAQVLGQILYQSQYQRITPHWHCHTCELPQKIRSKKTQKSRRKTQRLDEKSEHRTTPSHIPKMSNFSMNSGNHNQPPPSPRTPGGGNSGSNNHTRTASGFGARRTKQRNEELEKKIQQMALPLAPLVQLTSGTAHPAFPSTLLNFWLLTDEQLEELALFYHQRWPCQYTQHYPCPITWTDDLTLEEKRRKIGKFIGLRGVSSFYFPTCYDMHFLFRNVLRHI